MKNSVFWTNFATYIVFFFGGASMAIWGVLIPYTKHRLNLDEAELGSLLMLLGTGALIAMSVTGKIVSTFGCQKTILAMVCVVIFCLLGVNFIENEANLAALLLFFGVSIGVLDVTMNIQAVIAQKMSQKSKMSSFHALYSGGVFVFGLFLAGLLKMGVGLQMLLYCVLAVFFVVILYFSGWLSRGGVLSENTGEMVPDEILPREVVTAKRSKIRIKIIRPSAALITLSCIFFMAYLGEGAFLDWSAIFLRENRSVSVESAAVGFSLFFGAMTFGRFFGDFLAERFRANKIIALSALCVAFGVGIFVGVDIVWVGFVGCVLAGLGAANIVPVGISNVAHIKGEISLNNAVALISAVGYSGTLLGPAIIGYIAHASNLSVPFWIIAAAFVVVFLVALGMKINKKAE